MDSSHIDNLSWGSAGDWAQLVRLPTVFTLFSNCIVAAVVAAGSIRPVTAFVPLVLSSLCAYWAGMILNDVVDVDEDRVSRPHRPLVTGKISATVAGHVANGMLLVGPILVLVALTLHTSAALWMGAAFLASVLLSLSVRTYNSAVKYTPLGPPLMGVCRALNILMVGCGMLAIVSSEPKVKLIVGPTNASAFQLAAIADEPMVDILPQVAPEPLPEPNSTVTRSFPRSLLGLAAGIGLYIFGVTVYARREEQESSPATLVMGIVLEVVGLVLIGLLPLWGEVGQTWTLNPNQGYPLLVGLIALTVVNRGVAGVLHPVPRKVQLAVKHAILTLILIDAAVVLMWAGPWYGCATVALLLPALSAAIQFRST